MIQRRQQERNVFAPRLGAPLLTAYNKQKEVLDKRLERVKNDETSKEFRVFNAVFYSAIVRKEYANEKLRDALTIVSDNKQLYRHEVKQKVKQIRKDLAKWDIDIAQSINRERDEQGEQKVEYYDALNEYAVKYFDKYYMPFYYSILQLLTKYDCPFRKEAAAMETACALQEFTQRQLDIDVAENYQTAPPLVQLGNLLDTGIVSMTTHLRGLISTKAAKGKGNIDLNSDSNTEQAASNLFGILSSPEAINNVVDTVFAPKFETEK